MIPPVPGGGSLFQRLEVLDWLVLASACLSIALILHLRQLDEGGE